MGSLLGVSILARPSRAGRRCVRHDGADLAQFQSSLGPHGPGVDGASQPIRPQANRFNPRSALTGRASFSALVVIGLQHPVSILARPSRAGRPGFAGADDRRRRVSILARPSRAGRHQARRDAQGLRQVSILARPSRAGRLVATVATNDTTMFQSSLGPHGPGVFARRRYSRAARRVSILARPSRAGRRSVGAFMAVLFVFQSSLGPHGPGVPWNGNLPWSNDLFQSSLGPHGPGVRRPDENGLSRSSFNPRSALTGRASGYFRIITEYERVSILARPSRAGRRGAPKASRKASMFQSSLGPHGPGVGARHDGDYR